MAISVVFNGVGLNDFYTNNTYTGVDGVITVEIMAPVADPAWDETKVYGYSEGCTYGEKGWVSKADGNLGNTPEEGDWWTEGSEPDRMRWKWNSEEWSVPVLAFPGIHLPIKDGLQVWFVGTGPAHNYGDTWTITISDVAVPPAEATVTCSITIVDHTDRTLEITGSLPAPTTVHRVTQEWAFWDINYSCESVQMFRTGRIQINRPDIEGKHLRLMVVAYCNINSVPVEMTIKTFLGNEETTHVENFTLNQGWQRQWINYVVVGQFIQVQCVMPKGCFVAFRQLQLEIAEEEQEVRV